MSSDDVRQAVVDSEMTTQDAAPNTAGEELGPYHLVQKIGEGGMGEVWLAEQREPIRRTVAVKVIKAGMDTRRVVARFEAERQALALMDHPSIVKVLDAGATAKGRAYFAMEYVHGEPLTTYCDRNRLTMADRLQLFMHVCDAVQHAHQKGVIHRDLKPSNILVAIQGDQPVPKIIDFGIAKATAQRFTEQTVFTELGVLIGTPEYISPEQAELTGLDVDTRTDVYSLGVILYELLTGVLPFDSKSLRRAALDELRRQIREVEPPRPSTKVTTLGEASADAARKRKTEPTHLASQLKGDLDWITMKALEKDRTRRYGTVSDLAADIGRHLSHQPVLASPPSAIYRTRKFVRRHRLGVATALALLVVLVAFAATMAVQARRIAHERDRANREAAAAKQVSEFLTSLFKVSNPSESKGNTVTAREILDRGAARIEHDLAQQPLTQASLMTTMGQAYMNLGLYSTADPILSKGLATRQRLLGEQSEGVRVSLLALGDLRWRQGKYDEGERLLKQSLAVAEGIDRDGPGVAEALLDLGALYDTRGRSNEAETCFRRALGIAEKKLDPDDPLQGRALNNLGSTLWSQGKYGEVEPLFLRSLALKERTLGAEHPQVANTLNNLGILYQTQQKFKEGEPYFLRALAISEKVYGPDHRVVGDVVNNLGSFYYAQDRYAESEPYYQRARVIYEKTLGPDHDDFGMVLHNLANVYRAERRYAEAEPLYLRSHAIWEKALGPQHPYIGKSFREHATMYRGMGRTSDAESLYKKALAMLEKNPGPEHPDVAETLEEYAKLLRTTGRDRDADTLDARAKAIRDKTR